MSHGVTTDVVKFQAYLGRGDQMEDGLIQKLCEPLCWLELQEEEHDVENPVLTESHGWTTSTTLDCDDVVAFGKRGRLYGYQWVKGEHKVFCWNSSQFSNGGDLEGSVAANDRASLEVFLVDFKDELSFNDFSGKIQEDDVAEQWG